jgi:hypothetical protein
MASRNSGFGSLGFCSRISFPSLWKERIEYCSYVVSREVLLSGLRRVIFWSMGPYWCWLRRICCAYAECRSLLLM